MQVGAGVKPAALSRGGGPVLHRGDPFPPPLPGCRPPGSSGSDEREGLLSCGFPGISVVSRRKPEAAGAVTEGQLRPREESALPKPRRRAFSVSHCRPGSGHSPATSRAARQLLATSRKT